MISTLFVYAALLPSPRWMALSGTMKGVARRWFITRAERKGIPWSESFDSYQARESELKAIFEEIEDPNVFYPSYYRMPFHGYDNGNLDWKAAFEMEASTYSMSSGYWDDTEYGDSSRYVRGNFTQAVSSLTSSPRRILDLGCSTGISTAHLAVAFPEAESIVGVDLSPFFLSVANATCGTTYSHVEFRHANAEDLPYEDESFDLVCISYMMHELPEEAARNVLQECNRVLCKTNGAVAIVDLDPRKLDARLVSSFRRWAFEATEPHIHSYNTRANCGIILMQSGFSRVSVRPNDPLNTVWVGMR